MVEPLWCTADKKHGIAHIWPVFIKKSSDTKEYQTAVVMYKKMLLVDKYGCTSRRNPPTAGSW